MNKVFTSSNSPPRKLILIIILLCMSSIIPANATELTSGNLFYQNPTPASTPQAFSPDHRLIYVPSEALQIVIDEAGQGLFLEYEKYRELLDKYEAAKHPELTPTPFFTEPIVSGVEVVYRVQESSLLVERTYEFVSSNDEWTAIDFYESPDGIMEMQLDGQKAPVMKADDKLTLLIKQKGHHQFRLVRMLKSDAQNALVFEADELPYQAIKLIVPGLTEITSTASIAYLRKDDQQTEALLYPTSNKPIQVSWKPEKQIQTGESHLAVEVTTDITLNKSIINYESELSLRHLKGAADSISLSIPADLRITTIKGSALSYWETNRNRLDIFFHQPFNEGTYVFNITGHEFVTIKDDQPTQMTLAGFRPATPSLFRGVIRLRQPPEDLLITELKAGEGFQQMRPPNADYLATFAYAEKGGALSYSIAERKKTPEVAINQLVRIEETHLSILSRISFNNAELHGLSVKLPPDFVVSEMTRERAGKITDWHITRDHNASLLVAPYEEIRGQTDYLIKGEITFPGNILEKGSGDAINSLTEINMPILMPVTNGQLEGILILSATPTLKMEEQILHNLYTAGSEIWEQYAPLYTSDTLIYEFKETDVKGRLKLSAAETVATGNVVSYLAFTEKLCQVNAALNYNLSGSGTREFKFALPYQTGRKITIDGEEIKEKNLIESSPEKGDIWEVKLHDRKTGTYSLFVSYDFPHTSNEKGVALPDIRLLGVIREVCYLVIEAGETIELLYDKPDIEEVSFMELPPHVGYAPAHRLMAAYRYTRHPLDFRIEVIKHEDLGLLGAYITNLTVTTFIGRNGRLWSQADLKLLNTNVQFLPVTLPKRSDLLSALVNGEGCKPAKDDGQIIIPLVNQEEQISVDKDSGETLTVNKVNVQLIYETRLRKVLPYLPLSMPMPEFPYPIASTTANLYYPDDFRVMKTSGSLSGGDVDYYRRSYFGGLFLKFFMPFQLLRSRYSRSIYGTGMKQEEGLHFKLPQSETQKPKTAAEKKDEKPAEVTADKGLVDIAQFRGLLSMEVDIPKEGAWQAFKRPDGNGDLSVYFAHQDTLKRLEILLMALVIVIGWIVTDRKMLTGRGLFVAGVTFCWLAYGFGMPWLDLFIYGVEKGFVWLGVILFFRYLARKVNVKLYAVEKKAAVATLLLIAILGLPHISKAQAPITAFVPYQGEKPEKIGPGQSVYLPQQTFEELWKTAYPDQNMTQQDIPTDYLLVHAEYTGVLAADNAEIEGYLTIQVLRKGWTKVPLSWRSALLKDLTQDGQSVAMTQTDDGVAVLLEGPKDYLLKVTLRAPYEGDLRTGRLAFGLPQFAGANLRLKLPNQNLKVKASTPFETEESLNDTVAILALGFQENVNVSWEQIAGASDQDLEAVVHNVQEVTYSLTDTVLFVEGTCNYTINVAPINTLDLDFEPEVEVISLAGDNVESWQVKLTDGRKRLRVHLAKGIQGDVSFQFQAFQMMPASTVQLPKLITLGCQKEEYQILVFKEAGRECTLQTTNLFRIQYEQPEKSNLESFLNAEFEHAASYRAGNSNWQIKAHLTPIPLQTRVQTHADYRFTPGNLEIIIEDEFNVSKGKRFSFSWQLPTDTYLSSYRRIDDQSKSMGNALSSKDGQFFYDRERGRLNWFTRQPVSGQAKFELHVHLPITHFAGDEIIENWRLPFITTENVDDLSGYIEINCDEGLEFQVKRMAGLTHSERLEKDRLKECCGYGSYDLVNPPFEFELTVQPVKTALEMTGLTCLHCQTDIVQVNTTFFGTVQQGLPRTLSFLVPKELRSTLAVKSKALRQKRWTAYDGRFDRLELEFQIPLRKQFTVSLEAFKEIRPNQPLPIHPVKALDVQRPVGYVALYNASQGEVKTEQLSKLDQAPWDTIQEADVKSEMLPDNLVASWKYVSADWNLSMAYYPLEKAEELKGIVDYIHIESVLTDLGQVKNYAVIRMQNRTEQYLELKLPEEAELWSTYVAGRPVKPVGGEGSDDTFMLPLIKNSPGDRAFDVEITYIFPEWCRLGRLGRASFHSLDVLNLPVTKTLMTLWLPEAKHWFRFGGNMSPITEVSIYDEKVKSLLEEQDRMIEIIETGNEYAQTNAYDNLSSIQREIEQNYAKARTTLSDVIMGRRSNVQRKGWDSYVAQSNEAISSLTESQKNAEGRLRKQQNKRTKVAPEKSRWRAQQQAVRSTGRVPQQEQTRGDIGGEEQTVQQQAQYQNMMNQLATGKDISIVEDRTKQPEPEPDERSVEYQAPKTAGIKQKRPNRPRRQYHRADKDYKSDTSTLTDVEESDDQRSEPGPAGMVLDGAIGGKKAPPRGPKPKPQKKGVLSLKVDFERSGIRYDFKKIEANGYVTAWYRGVKIARKFKSVIYLVILTGICVGLHGRRPISGNELLRGFANALWRLMIKRMGLFGFAFLVIGFFCALAFLWGVVLFFVGGFMFLLGSIRWFRGLKV